MESGTTGIGQIVKKKETIQKLIREGSSFTADNIKIFCKPSDRSDGQIFFSLSKKLFTAVRRNYIKRVVRELVRKYDLKSDLFIQVNNRQMDFKRLESFFKDLRDRLNEENINNSN